MKFACITNTQGIEVLARRYLGYHLALGQHLVTNYQYREFYHELHKRGAFIIVDNGAAEPASERMPFDAVVGAALAIGADEIVMPDVLRDEKETLRRTTDPAVLSMVPVPKRLVIPQGTTWDEWLHCMEELAMKVAFPTIGIAKHLEDLPGGRVHALALLKRHGYLGRYNVHYFGAWEHPLKEARDAAVFGIRGMDTAAPLAYAQNSVVLNDKEHYSLNWAGVNGFEDRLFEINIDRMIDACNGG